MTEFETLLIRTTLARHLEDLEVIDLGQVGENLIHNMQRPQWI